MQPVHSEGDQPWDFYIGNDAKAESPVLWPPDLKNLMLLNCGGGENSWESPGLQGDKTSKS